MSRGDRAFGLALIALVAFLPVTVIIAGVGMDLGIWGPN